MGERRQRETTVIDSVVHEGAGRLLLWSAHSKIWGANAASGFGTIVIDLGLRSHRAHFGSVNGAGKFLFVLVDFLVKI